MRNYALRSLFSFVERYGDDNLVLVVLGDHQPATVVSRQVAGHDVPISIVARDPAVLAQGRLVGWEDGMSPSAGAPVWPMARFATVSSTRSARWRRCGMRQDERAPFDRALQGARVAAYGPASTSGRRASCAPARSGRWRSRPGSLPASRCSTCAAASPGPEDYLVGELGFDYLGVDAQRERGRHRP